MTDQLDDLLKTSDDVEGLVKEARYASNDKYEDQDRRRKTFGVVVSRLNCLGHKDLSRNLVDEDELREKLYRTVLASDRLVNSAKVPHDD